MKINLKKYLLYSSLFAIFTEAFFFNFIIDWKLLYLIILTNYILMVRIKTIKFNIYFLLLNVFFFVHGALAYTIIGIPYNFMLSQIIGIMIVGTYYYNFVPLYTKEELIEVYSKMCVYVSVLGYALYLVNYNTLDYRLMSIFKEPAHYVVVVIPACYYFLKTKQWRNFAIIFGTLLISNSSLGYIGCGLMFVVPNLTLRRMGYLAGLIPVVCVVFYFVYQEVPMFRMRFDDTYNSLNVINTGKFEEKTNLSSYVMIGNMYIAKQNIIDHPLGSGIGSHHYMHTEVYSKQMRAPKYLVAQNLKTSNSFDANSLFTRICSEFGIIGFLFVLFALYKASDCFSSDDLFMAQGIFVYFLMKLFRDGHYFPPELFFFIWFFYHSMRNSFIAKPEVKPEINP
ncbi:MAG TPA: O-antigen ligase family protein [Flavobacterium sp.]|nr:O-antigen ligase family protein [Flavobacterium sp.]